LNLWKLVLKTDYCKMSDNQIPWEPHYNLYLKILKIGTILSNTKFFLNQEGISSNQQQAKKEKHNQWGLKHGLC
jgi:hypothetical protein